MRQTLALLALTTLLACGDKTDDTADGEAATDSGSDLDGGDTDGGDLDGGDTDTTADTDEDSDGDTDEDTAAEPVITDIDSETLAAWLDDEAAGGLDLLLINTHVPDQGEIPGTDVHVAYTEGAELVAAVGEDLGRLVVVYCRTGPMSLTAAQTLVDAGYTQVHDLPEGMVGWQGSGRDLAD